MTASAVVPLSVRENCLIVAEESDFAGDASAHVQIIYTNQKATHTRMHCIEQVAGKGSEFPLYRRPAYFRTCSENLGGPSRNRWGDILEIMKLRAMQLRRKCSCTDRDKRALMYWLYHVLPLCFGVLFR